MGTVRRRRRCGRHSPPDTRNRTENHPTAQKATGHLGFAIFPSNNFGSGRSILGDKTLE